MDILFLVCNTGLGIPKKNDKFQHPIEVYRDKLFYKRVEVYTTIPASDYQETWIEWLVAGNKWDRQEALDYYKKLNIKCFNLNHPFKGKNKLDFVSAKAALESLLEGLSRPVTTVVSTNYAHNLSAPLSHLAFEQSNSQYPIKLVINLDYHFDCGGGRSLELGVDNGGWGKHVVLRTIPTASAQIYATFGVKDQHEPGGLFADGEGLEWNGGGRGGKDKRTLMDEIENIVKRYKEAKIKGVDTYVSVDRDVLTYGDTDFRPGKAERGIFINTIDPLLARLKTHGPVNVVGFDITGLPKDIDENCTNTLKAVCDINDWCGIIKQHML